MEHIDTVPQGSPRSATLTELLRCRLNRSHSEPEVAVENLDELLLEIISSAQSTHTAIALPPDVFVAYLGDRLPDHAPPRHALRQMHTTDLYLACACVRGDILAFAAFEDLCISRLDRVLSKMGIAADVTTEVKQDIRTRVLVGDSGHAQIADFSGRGDLRGWVHVMAVRQALKRQCRIRREVPLDDDDEMLQRIALPADPELAYAKRIYRQEFKQAFEAALRDLPDRDRLLLRQHYIDGSTIDELGRLYHVHRSTAARLVDRARLALLEATRARMMSRLDVHPEELDSILRMIRSQLEVSFRALYRRRKR
jgi:RNA polymerase sigma-70 factor, ECF subfamily